MRMRSLTSSSLGVAGVTTFDFRRYAVDGSLTTGMIPIRLHPRQDDRDCKDLSRKSGNHSGKGIDLILPVKSKIAFTNSRREADDRRLTSSRGRQILPIEQDDLNHRHVAKPRQSITRENRPLRICPF